jgi:hydroxymethylbilane synthase
LLRYNKDFKIVDIRGNVETRLRKMEEGYCDAMIMATAGLQRLELDKYITEIIEPDVIIPATSQGAIAIESRMDDPQTDAFLKEINDQNTWNAIDTERAFLRNVEGGCQVPVGSFTKIDQETITITGFVASVDGLEYLEDSETGLIKDGEAIGLKLAENLIAKGAKRILADIRK